MRRRVHPLSISGPCRLSPGDPEALDANNARALQKLKAENADP